MIRDFFFIVKPMSLIIAHKLLGIGLGLGLVAGWQGDLLDMTFRYFYLRYILTLIIIIM